MILPCAVDVYKATCKVRYPTYLVILCQGAHTYGYDWFVMLVRQQSRLQQNLHYASNTIPCRYTSLPWKS